MLDIGKKEKQLLEKYVHTLHPNYFLQVLRRLLLEFEYRLTSVEEVDEYVLKLLQEV